MEHRTAGQATEHRTQTDPRRRVLIVDDDRVMRQIFTTFFEGELPEYSVTTASDGESGLAAFLAERPHVVLLDVTMPGMDGLKLLTAIRATDQNVPVIMVTGATESEPAEALRGGAFAYIPKPFDFRYVKLLVAMAVERRRPSRAAAGASSASPAAAAAPAPANK